MVQRLESACQCWRHGFSLWSGKMPRAGGQRSLCTASPEPVLAPRDATTARSPALRLEISAPLAATRESRGTAANTQCSQKQANQYTN